MSKPSEGVIKFQLDFTPAPALPAAELAELNAWRKIMFQLDLIGQQPDRYAGYGFGNISRRLRGERFVISGTQTGGLPNLLAEHYAVVLACMPHLNRLTAQGPIKPSAESLTHGAVYALDETANWVMHAHSPHIWRHAAALNLPTTHPEVPYGSVEMAAEVERLFAETPVKETRIFSMGGHEDGIVTFGPSALAAGQVMLTALARAYQLGMISLQGAGAEG
ncbi:MAG: hypothetical protein FOGNACKC_03756 [Anaerolineae bacterium]|nr:hypothetical protein [Anaerolineae bacterium]